MHFEGNKSLLGLKAINSLLKKKGHLSVHNIGISEIIIREKGPL